jgi:formylmethanofuran dehydrogenase subunit C
MSLQLAIRNSSPTGAAPFRSASLAKLSAALHAGAARSELTQLPILCDGRPALLGDWFTLSGDASNGRITCVGDFSRVHYLGAGMHHGEIHVTGNVGRHAGEGMTGGLLRIDGAAGDWLACGMAGGEVVVGGDAGDNAAAALPGFPRGMTGGQVLIHGSAGDLAGSRMRRGLLAIGGDSGAAAGFELRAGTVIVAGQAGPHVGLGMRRGSIILLTPPGQSEIAPPESPPRGLPPTFRRGSLWRPAFLPLLGRQLSRAGFAAGEVLATLSLWQQWHGDSLCGGRGEVLLPARFPNHSQFGSPA